MNTGEALRRELQPWIDGQAEAYIARRWRANGNESWRQMQNIRREAHLHRLSSATITPVVVFPKPGIIRRKRRKTRRQSQNISYFCLHLPTHSATIPILYRYIWLRAGDRGAWVAFRFV